MFVISSNVGSGSAASLGSSAEPARLSTLVETPRSTAASASTALASELAAGAGTPAPVDELGRWDEQATTRLKSPIAPRAPITRETAIQARCFRESVRLPLCGR